MSQPPKLSGHEADARLAQPAGQQQLLAEAAVAVAVARARVFALDVERFASPG